MSNETKLLYNEALRSAYMDEIKGLFATCFDSYTANPVSAVQSFESGAAKAENLLGRLLK
jgi:hypothetical protein